MWWWTRLGIHWWAPVFIPWLFTHNPSTAVTKRPTADTSVHVVHAHWSFPHFWIAVRNFRMTNIRKDGQTWRVNCIAHKIIRLQQVRSVITGPSYEVMCATTVNDIGVQQQRVKDACKSIGKTPGTPPPTYAKSLARRAACCAEKMTSLYAFFFW
jgi:hypothetical protein